MSDSQLDRKVRSCAIWCHRIVLIGGIPIILLHPIVLMMNTSSHDTAIIGLILQVITAFILPVINYILSAVIVILILKINRHRHEFIEESGKEAVNFLLSAILYSFIFNVFARISCGIVPLTGNVIFNLLGLAAIINFIFLLFTTATSILASIQTSKDRIYHYPTSIHFLK